MRFRYQGPDGPSSVGFGVRQSFDIEDGEFEVPSELDEYVAEETPHVPIFEEDLEYRQLQLVASRFDDVKGTLSEDELRDRLHEVTENDG